MTDGASIPDTIVFDAEPLIAYFCNEPGSETVETYVNAAEGAANGSEFQGESLALQGHGESEALAATEKLRFSRTGMKPT